MGRNGVAGCADGSSGTAGSGGTGGSNGTDNSDSTIDLCGTASSGGAICFSDDVSCYTNVDV